MAFNYYVLLDGCSRARYDSKLSSSKLVECPYKFPAGLWENNPTKWPSMEYGDIYNYLIETPGVYTRESMKNYKSLEAHNAFRSGWVETVHCYKIPDTQNILLSAKVKPSQRLNDEPYSPWIVASKHGQILAAHCNCMAGLGESCSHVSAILFKIEAAVRLGYTTRACTEQPCKWNKDFVKKVGPDRIAKIDFFKEKTLTKAKTRHKKRKQEFSPTNANKQNEFLSSLNELNSKPVVLSCFEQYSESFHWKKRPKPDPKLPPSMRTLFSENNKNLSQEDLNSLCASQFQKLQISDDQIDYICKSTTSQSDSMMWHEQREGRITSSTVHSVIRTDQDNPARSTISNICNPKKRQLNSNPIKWGNENEEKGLKSYKQLITHSVTAAAHKNVSIKKDGFMISKQKPFIGVSTDSLMKCECHGLRVVEIKCPYTARDKDVQSFLSSSDCYIVNKELKKTHKYYSQVQLQMFVYNVQMCDFVIWSPKFVIVTFVPRDETFITNMLERCERFFKKHILPEMLTRKSELSVTTTTASIEPTKDMELYCICQQPEDDREYIGCDNPTCAVQWFHMACLKMKHKPKGSWYCSSCMN